MHSNYQILKKHQKHFHLLRHIFEVKLQTPTEFRELQIQIHSIFVGLTVRVPSQNHCLWAPVQSQTNNLATRHANISTNNHTTLQPFRSKLKVKTNILAMNLTFLRKPEIKAAKVIRKQGTDDLPSDNTLHIKLSSDCHQTHSKSTRRR